MASSLEGLEGQNKLFEKELDAVPQELQRATLRMDFPPSYIIVGVYRLFTDKALAKAAWDKCKHGVRRGAIVGAIWAFFTFSLQVKFIEVFLKNSPRIIGLSDNTRFGYKIPFNVQTYAALVYLGRQVTYILRFFLSKNIRIAKSRAWDQTVASRGKGPEYWQPYVEEWEHPPRVEVNSKLSKKYLGNRVSLFVLKQILLIPADLYPFLGIAVSAAFKALGTGEYLHRSYFKAKKMTDKQIAVFVEERKWDYRLFGFAAALLEGLPIIGLAFTISNQIGGAMWAFDLEKRQHFVAATRAQERCKPKKAL